MVGHSGNRLYRFRVILNTPKQRTMKLQLDYDKKVLTIENNVNMGEFFSKVKKILPDWDDWKLETKNKIVFQYPYVVREPYYPWWEQPHITWTTQGTSTDINCTNTQHDLDSKPDSGTYHLEI